MKNLKRYISVVLVFVTIFTYILPDNEVYGSTVDFNGTTSTQLQTIINNARDGDTIVLRSNVTVTSQITIPEDKSITITDDGKVRTIGRAANYKGNMIEILMDARLTLKGSGSLKESLIITGNKVPECYNIILISNGALNLYDGVVIENHYGRSFGYTTSTASAVNVGHGFTDTSRNHPGHFNMYGGIIRNNINYRYGAGVYVDAGRSSFSMYGGIIVNNTSLETNGFKSYGGGVSGTRYVYIHDGKIINNKADEKGKQGYYGFWTHNTENPYISDRAIISDNYGIVTGMTISGPSTVNVGSGISLKATVSPSHAVDKSVSWYSGNNNVATVDQNGNVKGVSPGTATITASANDGSGVKASKTIEVKSVLVSKITISGNNIVNKGDTIVLKAAVTPSNANNKNITWSSSNNSVAAVDGVGTSAIVRGIKKGTATITASANDGSGIKASKTIEVKSDTITGEAKYITVDDIISYETGYADPENDPKFLEEYKYIHNPNSLNGVLLDNSMGYADFRDKWQDISYNQFSKVGTYTVQYRVKDNPPTAAENSKFANYRYYSDVAESTIFVHRKPIAIYSINGNTVVDNSYDLDHSVSHSTKGIAKWEWQYINSSGVVEKYTTTSKSDGINKVNSWLSGYKGVEYKLVLRVQDIEGAWSKPCIKEAGEISRPVANFIIDKNPMIYKMDTQKITDMSYDTNGLALSYNWTVIKGGQTVLTSTANDISSSLNQAINNLYPNVTGVYSVSLKVTNSAGVQSDTVTKNFRVIVYNQTPSVDFDLVSNESPLWSFPKTMGLHTLKYRPANSFFHEEKTNFNVNVSDPNPENTGFVYDWKFERFDVRNIKDISGTAANTYNYTNQYPFTNSFQNQGLPWGAYRITFSVTDKPPIPPYASGDAKTATVTKTYYIVPELSLTGSFESPNEEVIVGDTVKLKAKTSRETENVSCTLVGTKYNLSKISQDSNFAYWEEDIVVPDSITESGTYQLQFVGKTTYGGNGNVTREVKDNVPIDIIALKIINFRITNIVNHPHIIFPQTKDMLEAELVPYKAGYYVTFKIDSKGKPDNVYGRIDIGNNGSIDQVKDLTKVASGDSTETWQGRFYTPAILPSGTVISIKLDCKKGAVTYDYNLKESWDGRSLITEGSALQDGRINLTN